MEQISLNYITEEVTNLPHKNNGTKSILHGTNLTQLKNNNASSANRKYNELQKHYEETNSNTVASLQLKESNKKLRATIESASILAHSLRSPLSTISLLAESRELPPSYQNLLSIAFHRMNEIIEDIQVLDSAHAITYENELVMPENINEVLKDLCKHLKFINQQDQNIDFQFQLLNEDVFAKIPLKSFKDAIYNLVKNSYESIEFKGNVQLSLKIVKTQLNITITDNGCGIPEKIINKLGEKRVTYGKKQGSGIGLYQVKKMLKKCNGKMLVESNPKGTEICLIFDID